jgi:DNA-binding response OmpR family regulator
MQGWQALQDNSPDAVILDLFMPDMDGFTFLQQMRSNARFVNIPVMILTGADLTPEQSVQLAELNQQMLSKSSLQKGDLLVSLEKALRHYRR